MIAEKAKKGFTLIELLVVISIIALLASVVLTSVNSARVKARDARRLADLDQVRLALDFYLDANSRYPGVPTTYYWISDNNYNESLPCSNTNGLKPWLVSVCSFNDSLGYPYAYTIIDDTHYRLGARFELPDHKGTPFLGGGSYGIIANYFEPK